MRRLSERLLMVMRTELRGATQVEEVGDGLEEVGHLEDHVLGVVAGVLVMEVALARGEFVHPKKNRFEDLHLGAVMVAAREES